METEYLINRVKRVIVKHIYLLIPFLSNLILLRLSPEVYDGWAGSDYYFRDGGLVTWIPYILGPYRNEINGRMALNILTGILESFYSEWLLDLAVTGIITAILYFSILIFEIKQKMLASIIFTSLVALISYPVRVYDIQVAGVQYLTPILFLLILMQYMKQREEGKKWNVRHILIICICASCWMENTSVAFGAVFLTCFVIGSIKEKKVDKELLLCLCSCVIAGALMMTAGGMKYSRVDFTQEALVEISVDRIAAHLNGVFEIICNGNMESFTISLVFLSLSVYMLKCDKTYDSANKKWVLLCFINLISTLSFAVLAFGLNEFRYTAKIRINKLLYLFSQIVQSYSVRLFLVFIFITVYFLWLIVNTFAYVRNKKVVFCLWLYSLALIIVMLPTSQAGVRIYAPAFLIIIVLCVGAVSSIVDYEKSVVANYSIWWCFLLFGTVLALDYQLQLYQRLNRVNQERAEIISALRKQNELGLLDLDEFYIMPVYNARDLFMEGSSDFGTYHYPQFLSRYGLHPQLKLVFTNRREPLLISYTEKSPLGVYVKTDVSEKYWYNYTLFYKETEQDEYLEIDNIHKCKDNRWNPEPICGNGYYKIEASIQNMKTEELVNLDDLIEYRIE